MMDAGICDCCAEYFLRSGEDDWKKPEISARIPFNGVVWTRRRVDAKTFGRADGPVLYSALLYEKANA